MYNKIPNILSRLTLRFIAILNFKLQGVLEKSGKIQMILTRKIIYE